MSILQTFSMRVSTANAQNQPDRAQTDLIATYADKVKKYENNAKIRHAHFDSKGLLTLGYGHLLVNPQTRQLPKYEDLKNSLAKTGINLTNADYAVWQKAVRTPAQYPNKQITDGLALDYEQMDSLLKKDATDKHSWLDAYIGNNADNNLKHLPKNAQLALLDLSFRGGANLIGPNVREAIRKNDMAALLFEVRYNSNGDDLFNNDARNFEFSQDLYNSLDEQQLAAYHKLKADHLAKVAAVARRAEKHQKDTAQKDWAVTPALTQILADINMPQHTTDKAPLHQQEHLIPAERPQKLQKILGPTPIVRDPSPTQKEGYFEIKQRLQQQGDVQVSGYRRTDGTVVPPHTRSRAKT